MVRFALLLVSALWLAGCATTPTRPPGLTLIVWPKAGNCDYIDPDRSTARTIKYVLLGAPLPGQRQTRSVYTTDWSEPFDMPDKRGYCIVMARDVRAVTARPAVLFGFEMHHTGAAEVEITPKLVQVRQPTVASGTDGKVAFSALFTLEQNRGGGASESRELSLGRIGIGSVDHFNSAIRLAWPAPRSRLSVTFTETTD